MLIGRGLVDDIINYKLKSDQYELQDQYEDVNEFERELTHNMTNKKYLKNIIKDLNNDIYLYSEDMDNETVRNLYFDAKSLKQKIYSHLRKIEELEIG